MKAGALALSVQASALWQRLMRALPWRAVTLARAEARPEATREGGAFEPPARSTRAIGVTVCVATAAIAAWLTFSDLHRGNNADSLIPAFVSLYRWTWFYWVQNRYGMLVPLLAAPIHSPLLNLLFQNWVAAFTGLLVFPLVTAYLLGWRRAPLAGLLAAAIFLLTGPERFHGEYLIIQPYGVSTCLGLVGLMLMDSDREGRARVTRLLLAAALYFLSFWVSLAAVFLVLPLFALRWGVERARGDWAPRRFLASVAAIMVPAVANWQVAVHYPYRGDFGWTPPQTWPSNTVRLLKDAYQTAPPAFLVTLAVVLAIGVVATGLGSGPLRRKSVAAFSVAVLTGTMYLTVLAATIHVRENGFPFRYALAPIVLCVAAVAFLVSSTITHALKARWQPWLHAVVLLGLLVGVTRRYGLPSYTRVHGILDARFGSATRFLLENHVTHVLGDYWDVWGRVFAANVAGYEAGSKTVIWAVTHRSQATRDLWFPPLDGGLVAVVKNPRTDANWMKQAKSLQLPELTLLEETQSVRLLAPTSPTSPGLLKFSFTTDMATVGGAKEDDTVVCNKYSCKSGLVAFGPYTTAVSGGQRVATFRVSGVGVSTLNRPAVTFDVYDSLSRERLALRTVNGTELPDEKQQDIEVAFIAPEESKLEFRVGWQGEGELRMFGIEVH
jgi:hypothetical protein